MFVFGFWRKASRCHADILCDWNTHASVGVKWFSTTKSTSRRNGTNCSCGLVYHKVGWQGAYQCLQLLHIPKPQATLSRPGYLLMYCLSCCETGCSLSEVCPYLGHHLSSPKKRKPLDCQNSKPATNCEKHSPGRLEPAALHLEQTHCLNYKNEDRNEPAK